VTRRVTAILEERKGDQDGRDEDDDDDGSGDGDSGGDDDSEDDDGDENVGDCDDDDEDNCEVENEEDILTVIRRVPANQEEKMKGTVILMAMMMLTKRKNKTRYT